MSPSRTPEHADHDDLDQHPIGPEATAGMLPRAVKATTQAAGDRLKVVSSTDDDETRPEV